MRRKNQEITDKKIIEEILSQSTVCRIAMMDHDRPYILPFNYGYSDNAIYIHSAPEGKKIDLLKQNNKVCFEIESYCEVIANELSCEWTTRYRSVVGYGFIEFITDYEQKRQALDYIMAQYGRKENNIYKEKQVELIVILKLHIEEICGKQLGE